MRFEWANTGPNEQAKLEILERLRQQTINLSQACGFAPGVVAYSDSWRFPNPEVMR